MFSRTSLLIICLVAFILSACSESAEKYNLRALSVADSIMSKTELNLAIASECSSSWRSVIFDHEYIAPITGTRTWCSDINTGLSQYAKDIAFVDSLSKIQKTKIDSTVSTIKEPTEKSKELFANIKELLVCYNLSMEAAFSPKGSLNSYTEDINELSRKYRAVKSNINLKKQV